MMVDNSIIFSLTPTQTHRHIADDRLIHHIEYRITVLFCPRHLLFVEESGGSEFTHLRKSERIQRRKVLYNII